MAPDVHLLDDQRAVFVAHELIHEGAHRVAQHDFVIAAEEGDRNGAHPLAFRAASTAAMTSAVRRAPRTSWARSTRLPSAIPRAWAA